MSAKALLGLAQKGISIVGGAGKAATNTANKVTGAAKTAGSKIAGAVDSKTAKIAGGVAAVAGVGLAANQLKNSASNAINDIGNAIDNIGAGSIGDLVGSAIPAILPSGLFGSSGDESLTYPTTLNNVALNPAHINFKFYKQNTKEQISSINLPMPDDVNNPSTISWDQESFGMVGNAVTSGLKNIKDSNGNIAAGDIDTQIKSMGERLKSLAFYTGAESLVKAAGGSASAEGIMGAVSGKMPNPYRTMLFRGVNFRTFSFKFDLVPFSESDCDLIYSIIQKFREHSYPDFAAEKQFFTYPDECLISYMWESSPNKWLNTFKRAVCTGIDVNLAPKGQWNSLRNGFPNMITLSTQWSEVEIITKGDITNAGY